MLRKDFDVWLAELDEVANKDGYKGSITQDSGSVSWHLSWMEGLSPKQAYEDDLACGE